MNQCHEQAVDWMKSFIESLPHHQYTRALEVACGDGRLTRDLLSKMYAEVDLFDQSEDAKKHAEENNIGNENVVLTDKYTMQAYEFPEMRKYSGIIARWCITYLSREEQLTFLKKAIAGLANEEEKYLMRRGPSSYIIILDNIEDDKTLEAVEVIDGHTIETEDYFRELFSEAGLTVFREESRQLNENYGKPKMWALF